MFRNFLGKLIHFIFLLALLFSWLFSLWSFFSLTFLIYIGLWALFRRNPRQDINIEDEMRNAIFSPTNGKVLEVSEVHDHDFFGKNVRFLKIVTQPWNEYSVLMPVRSEVQDFQFHPVSTPFRWFKLSEDSRVSSLGVCISFWAHQNSIVGLQFFRCLMGMWPRLLIIPGDRGKPLSRIGHFPFGGTALLYIPENYEILVENNEVVVAGATTVAAPKKSSGA